MLCATVFSKHEDRGRDEYCNDQPSFREAVTTVRRDPEYALNEVHDAPLKLK
jgi:hypothetical protein